MSITRLIKECANRNYSKASKLFESELEKKVLEILGDEKEDLLALDELEDCSTEEPKMEGDEEEVKVEAEGDEEEVKTESEDEEIKTEAEGDEEEVKTESEEDEVKTESEEEEELKTEAEGDEEEVKTESDEDLELDYVTEDDFEKIAESVLFGKRK